MNPNDPVDTHEVRTDFYIFKGLTKREYFAAMAMQNFLAGMFTYYDHTMLNSDSGALPAAVAKYSCEMADALIVELNKK